MRRQMIDYLQNMLINQDFYSWYIRNLINGALQLVIRTALKTNQLRSPKLTL